MQSKRTRKKTCSCVCLQRVWVPCFTVKPLIGKNGILLQFITWIVFHRNNTYNITTLARNIKYKIKETLQWYGGARMTHTAEQQKPVGAIETTDITASKCVIREKTSRTLIGEAHLFQWSSLSLWVSQEEQAPRGQYITEVLELRQGVNSC